MSNDGDYVERRTVTDRPAGREEVRETQVTTSGTGNAGWWIAAVVALFAVIGLVFLFMNQNQTDQLQAAHDRGVAEARLDAATADAQRSAVQASQAAQAAADSTARASRRAAEAAQAAADQTAHEAQSAVQSGQDASATAPAQQ